MKMNPPRRFPWKPVLTLLLIAAGLALIYASGALEWIELERLREREAEMRSYVAQHKFSGAALYVLAYIAIAALSLPVATFLTMLGGYLFGVGLGAALVLTGATTGSTLVFLLAKSAWGTFLREKAGGFYKKIEANLEENQVSYMLFLRLLPIFPFVVVNVVPALFNMRLRTFVWTSALGMLPGTLVYVYFGRSLSRIDSPGDVFSPQMMAAFGGLAALMLAPVLYRAIKRARARRREQAGAAS